MKIHSCWLVSVLLAGALPAQSVVNGFGVGGWYSWDTRDSSGAHLFGASHTHPSWYGNGTATSAADLAIADQIKFLGEGPTVITAAGVSPDPNPGGSLNGLGYVRLDGTSDNRGKSDISHVNFAGIAASSTLLDEGFSTTYRYFSDSSVSNRRVGLNIELVGLNAEGAERNFVFVHVQPDAGFTVDGWNTATVDGTSEFYLYGGGGTPNGTTRKTLAEWAADSTWGSLVFVEGKEIFRVGFNLGSAQRGGLNYVDWVQSSLLNDGAMIDFQAAAIPEPGTTAALIGALVGVVVVAVRRRRVERNE